MTNTASTAAIRNAYAELIARTVEVNAAYAKPVSIDFAWSECETLVDAEWHPIPLVSITWDNGNTVRCDDQDATYEAIRQARLLAAA